ncbi:MAG: hypothetical protein HY235_16460 [Acidobacteria bacterium]|nr:hypothetical protein [Acidobacteriota bacterium]
MSKHWTENDFLNGLYEIGPQDGHLEECAQCRQRWEQWAARRQSVLQPPEVPAELLARQRRRILESEQAAIRDPMARPQRSLSGLRMMRWSPAVAAAAMALLVVLWKTPAPGPQPQKSDAQLMAEIYRTVYDTEPDAVEPLHGLFEAKP